MTAATDDRAHMGAALALAARGLGDTWPNPAVGCVVVRDGHVVGRGWTQSTGRPHAEVEALARAGAAAAGATAYVTLEPCSHHGRTPPCVDALRAAGIARVVAAISDPDPRVNGAGFARLRDNGIPILEGIGAEEARALNRGFFLRITSGRPLFALKTAATLDGRIALASGESQWITGAPARAAAQTLRARYDAILVGAETALADDPALTCRLPAYRGRPKVRIVLDRRLRLSATAKLADTAVAPTWVVTTAAAAAARGAALTDRGIELLPLPEADDASFARAAAQALGERGLTRVLIEGGGRVAAAFLKADLIDELAWFAAPRVIGADGRPAVAALGLDRLPGMPRFRLRTDVALGEDRLAIYDKA